MKKKLLTITLTSALLLSNTSLILAETKATKDETIYISLEEDGSVKHADASIHLSSEQAIKNIEDRSNLDDIQNIKSEIQPELINGKIKWNTDEKDIYYTGKVTKKTPVTFSIDYKLNGKTIKLEDALGKDGQFEMQIKAQNNHRKNITVNGKQQNLFVPYAVLGLIPFDKDIFKNIDADHAKVISDGNKEMIAFVTLPGMKQNFDVKDIDEKIHIKADVKDLSMNPIYLTAVPLEIDLDDEEIDLSTIEDLKASLLEGLTELKDGTQALYEGNETFNEGVHQLELGTVSAKEGAQQLELGASALNGALSQAQSGSQSLASGATQVAQGNQQLANKFNEIINTINGNGANLASNALSEKVMLMKNKANSLEKKLDGYNEKIEEGKVKLQKNDKELQDILGEIGQKVEENNRLIYILEHPDIFMTSDLEDNLEMLRDIVAKLEIDDQKAVLEFALVQVKETQNELLKVQNLLRIKSNELIEAENKLNEVQFEITESLNLLDKEQKRTLAEINKYANELGAQLNQLAEGSQALAAGNQGLNAGISEIAGKAPELQAGTAALNSGLNELNSGASALSEGSDQLLEGSKTLYEAVAEVDVNEQQFDELLEYKDELEALMDNNDSFTGKNDTIESKVKFIYKTNKLEKEEEVIEHVEEENEEKGFFNWLKNLFK